MGIIKVMSSDYLADRAFVEISLTNNWELTCEIFKITETFVYGYYHLGMLSKPGVNMVSLLLYC